MAVSGTKVVGDAATGAALGSAAGPWGTAIGGVGGAAYGLLSGLFGGSSPSAPPPNPANFQLGQGNGSNYTNQIAAALANRGNVADQTGAGLQGQAASAYGAAAAAQGTSAPQIQQDAADRQRQLAALGGTVNSAGSLTGAAGQLQQLGTDGMPMGLAAAQLQQGENANMNQSLALAHSGRTLGGGAANLQQAQFQNAQTGQVTNQQAATANIAEQQQNQQFKLNALGGAQQGYGAAGGLYGQAGTQAGGVNQTDLGVQQTNAGLQQQQAGINNQTSSTFGNIGQGLNSSALGYEQLGANYQQQGTGVLGTQLQANENLGGANIGQGNINMQNQINTNNANNAVLSSGLQSLAQGVKSYAGSTPTPTGNAAGASGQAATQAPDFGTGGPVPSDRDVKTGITPANIAMALKPGGAPPSASSLIMPGAAALAAHAPVAAIVPGSPGSYGNGLPTHVITPPDPWGLNAPMPSGAPTHLAPQLPPGMANSLAALGGGQPGGGGGGAASPDLPPGATGGDPYLAAIAGAGKQYLPSGYWDPTLNDPAQAPMHSTTLLPIPGQAPVDAAHTEGAVLLDGNGNPLPGTTQTVIPSAPAPNKGNPNFIENHKASDVHSKTRIQQLESQLAALQPQQPDTSALDAAYRSQGGTPVAPPSVDLRPAQGYSYEYKDPAAHGQGRFFGPMAQDLEQTPAGASTVKRSPDGTKMVDTSRLALVNTSAISEQQRKLEAMQRQLAALSPQADTLARGYPAQYPTMQAPY